MLHTAAASVHTMTRKIMFPSTLTNEAVKLRRVLEDYFEITDCQRLEDAADGKISEFTDSVIGYRGKTHICTYAQQKP